MEPPAPTLDLLSVHVPKCGGTSLLNALRRVYGEALLEEYGDRPGDPCSPMNLDPDGFLQRARAALPARLQGKRAVHGHVHAAKYQALKVGFRTAIIREPIARLVSHFYHWKTGPRDGHRLRDYFLEEQLDLEGFARLPYVRYFYTRVFFRGLTLDAFDHIGTLEDTPKAITAISRGIGHRLDLGFENKGEFPAYAHGLVQVQGDPALQSRLAALLEEDIRFYDSVRARWA